jgi:hypothetical protein
MSYQYPTNLDALGWNWRSQMAAMVRTVSRASGSRLNVEALYIVAVCGVALVASLLLFSWSAHLGSVPTIELAVMNWI